MIFITTSNGVYRLQANEQTAHLVLPREKKFFFLRKGSGGFFGISPHPDGDSFIAASREKLGTPRHDKPWTDVRLYRIWEETSRSPETLADIHDIHDVHQIATMGRLVLLTDTGKNRIGIYDLDSDTTTTMNIGPERTDINHLNAVHVSGNSVLFGLNNRGDKPAEILTVPASALGIMNQATDALDAGTLKKLGDQTHTHDIEPFGKDYLYCASHDGRVHRLSTREAILHCGDWVRGLAVNDDGLWVGASALADRANRHREDLDGEVHLYDQQSLELIKTWQLESSGQVNDIVAF
jgi:hypothetical protein